MAVCTKTSFCCFPDKYIRFTESFVSKSGLVPNIVVCWGIRHNRIATSKLNQPVVVFFATETEIATEDLAFYLVCEDYKPLLFEAA